jgi:hypothetical protein
MRERRESASSLLFGIPGYCTGFSRADGMLTCSSSIL